MRILKIFNNNCVSCYDGEKEIIATGAGVGFQKKIGDKVDQNRIEKSYRFLDQNFDRFTQLIDRFPYDYFEITALIVRYANTLLEVELDDQIHISLTDHIGYALDRVNEGIEISEILTSELDIFYPKEYEVGLWALDLIEEMMNIKLPKQEAGYIAIHIINASSKNQSLNVQRTMYFVGEIIKIVSRELDVSIDEDGHAFSRLNTHLKYLAQRVFEKAIDENADGGDQFFKLLRSKLSRYNDCIEKIASFIQSEFDYMISVDERTYLSVHLHQIVGKKK